MILCWSVKGGCGTTVTAAALALVSAARRPTTLVDLGGDAGLALGAPPPVQPNAPGLSDWMGSSAATPDALARLAVPVAPGLRLLGRGNGATVAHRWADAVAALARLGATVVDGGSGCPAAELHAAATQSLLVTRACFLALRNAAHLPQRPSGVVLLVEPGRALRTRDVEHALGVPVVAELTCDPAVARLVDAGLLAGHLPRAMRHGLGRLVAGGARRGGEG